VSLAPSFATLLQYASLRGSHALLDSPLPSLICAIPDFVRKPFALRATAILCRLFRCYEPLFIVRV
jgi:hypothetical protein